MIRVLKFTLLLLLLFQVVAGGAESEYEIRFGIMEENQSVFKVVKETTEIPLQLKDSGFRYGFTVKNVKGALFDGYAVFHIPSAPTKIWGDVKFSVASESATIMKTEEKECDGFWAHQFWFDKGDPTGNWKIEVYVNQKLIKTIAFKVMQP